MNSQQTIVRTLNIPEIAQLRPRLVPEHTIYSRSSAYQSGARSCACVFAPDVTNRIIHSCPSSKFLGQLISQDKRDSGSAFAADGASGDWRLSAF